MESQIKLLGLTANHELANAVAEELHMPLTQLDIKRFADGEIYERILESIRGDDVYVIAPIAEEVNDAFMEMMIVVDALRRASAGQITLVIPYLGYARQDRKAKSREPITAKMVASLIEMNGVDRVVSMDLHAAQLQGFFDIPVDHLQAAPLLTDYFYSRNLTDDLVVVSPDHTGAGRARKFADLLGAPWGIVNDNVAISDPTSADAIVGDVKGRRAIIVDDIVDTGYRVQMTAKALLANGATEVYVAATHPVLSGQAAENLAADKNIERLIFTDTLRIPEEKQSSKFTTLSVAPLFAEAIRRIHEHKQIDVLLRSNNKPEVNL
ncbi:ribose-phosphate pyrophosphokinase [Weissella paramesenteroides]